MININKEFADYLYNRLPKIYRTSDNELILRRFIESFVEGGFQPLLQDTINIMDLLDVDKCPSRFLPQLCRMYGYEFTLEIPELFQRRLLKYIVEMYKRKGTKSVVRFIARELTGFDSEIIENKDFNEEHIELTKWDKKFENYRNFILKLTAPYEDSNLYNKEDIVVRLVNDFLPTNSQVFVITAYWFKEETELVKKSIEDCVYEAVNDYQGVEIHNGVSKSTIKEFSRKLKVNEIDYKYGWYGEEDSYINFPVEGGTLTTNTVLRLRDTVKLATEVYNNCVATLESLESNVAILDEGVYSRTFKKDSTTLTNRLYLKLEEYKAIIKPEVIIHDTFKEATHNEGYIRAIYDLETLDRVRDIFSDEINQSSSTKEADCGIIKPILEEYTHTYHIKGCGDNSMLNTSLMLITNGIVAYDIIKEEGKPNRIILL